MRNIELAHIGEDYIGINYKDENGKQEYVEIGGWVERHIIMQLGQSLLKESFLKAKYDEEIDNWILTEVIEVNVEDIPMFKGTTEALNDLKIR